MSRRTETLPRNSHFLVVFARKITQRLSFGGLKPVLGSANPPNYIEDLTKATLASWTQ